VIEPAIEQLAIEMAARVRDAVAPSLGEPGARAGVGVAPGGDVTMAIDEIAELVVHRTCAEAGDIAFYSEDQGYVEFGSPRAIFVIDPIDGTRPAAAGLESCCVSVAVVPPSIDATLGDVQFGVIHEIKTGHRFWATRGGAVYADDPVRLSTNTDLRALFWTAGLRGRPVVPMSVALEDLIDDSSMRGGFFDLGSCTFNMTRLVTGQLDAYVDLGAYVLARFPQTEPSFRRAGEGALCTNFPYDVAAVTLIVEAAGGVVTRPDGAGLADHPAVGSGEGYGVAVLASASPALHEALVAAVDAGMTRLERWLGDGNDGDSSVD
jgi:myo-inositol-1(or 4)-monophosphatase